MLGLLMLVREFDPAWRTVLRRRAQPGSRRADRGPGRPGRRAAAAFPTAFVAVLGLPGPWAEAAPGEARLLAFTVPAQLRTGPGSADTGEP